MSREDWDVGPPALARHRRRIRRIGGFVTLFALLALGFSLWGFRRSFQRRIGPEQPLPFSHRVHAGDKDVSCVFCHTHVIDTPRAGIPPLDTCMLCHEHIIIHYPYIDDLREHFAGDEPVEWVRVNHVPEYVYFDHQRHVRSGVDCAHCHGAVDEMDRVAVVYQLNMGFCTNCHRRYDVSVDCYVCHR